MARVRLNPESPAAQIKKMVQNRGWTQADLAYILGINVVTVNQTVTGKRAISAELAKLLGAAFDESPEYFMAMQAKWNLDAIPDPAEDVRARAYAHTQYPLREMAKRGWIDAPASGENTHAELCRFFGVNSLETVARLAHAARKANSGDLSGEQMAWLYRVRAIAKEMSPRPYSKSALENAVAKMSLFRQEPEEIRHIPRLLEEAGVRFVLVEGFPNGNIDGVCTWLDDGAPVIGMSLRFDRIDNFWFVLRHECSHVLHGHGKEIPKIDSDINSESQDIDSEERLANLEASDFCVSTEKLKSFYLRKQPFFSDLDVRAFAKIHHTHPGIVVGQIQNMSGRYYILRQHLVPVRKIITGTAMTDGWGQMVTVG